MKNLLCLCLYLLALPASAQLYKCVGDDGAKTYSSTPCGANAVKLHVLVPADVVQSDRPTAQARLNVDLDSPPPECKFAYFNYSDEKGRVLSEKASHECIRNIALKKAGRGNEVSTSDYAMWRDHHQMKGAKRRANTPKNCVPNGYGGFRCS